MSKDSKKKLYSYFYAPVKEGIKKKTRSYKQKHHNPTNIEYISHKTYKEICKALEEHNSHLAEGETPKIITVEGFTKIKPGKRNKDALLHIDFVSVEKDENGDEVRTLDYYEFDVSKNKPFAAKPKGYFFTSSRNRLIAITRSYIIPLCLVLIFIIGGGGIAVSRIIPGGLIEEPTTEFVPEIDEGINEEQSTVPGTMPNSEGIKVEGFSKWTIGVGETENLSIPLRNPAGNPCYFVFEIFVDKNKETEESIYKSKMVPPGEGIGNITINRAFEEGTYDVTIFISTIELETGKPLNSAELQVELIVA